MEKLIEHFKYRPEIDGLRAIAVTSVVLFHAGLGFPGGYVGVDVFFVISGFLITSLILKDLQQGAFSFVDFWQRRIRRILPALAVMVIVVLVAGGLLLLPEDYVSLGKSAAFQAICAANFFFWQDTGYFSGSAEEKPLLHTWSLAVEEQFYLIVPFLLFLLFLSPRLRKRLPLLIILASAFTASLVCSMWSLSGNPSATFYLLPSRAWELLLGSLLAVVPTHRIHLGWKTREALGWIGIAGILVPCFYYTSQTPFPGAAALPPCLGAFCFILGNSPARDGSDSRNLWGRLLSSRPFVFIGLISYSLYLWHWPLFAFSNYWSFESRSLPLRFSLTAAGVVLAVLSWRYVETPFRIKRICRSKPQIYAFGVSTTLCLIALSFAIWFFRGVSQRIPSDIRVYAAPEKRPLNNKNAEQIRKGNLEKIGKREEPPSVLIWGDSHARAMTPAFDLALNDLNLAGVSITYSATSPSLNDRQTTAGLSGQAKMEWCESALDFIRKNRISDTFLVGNWEKYTEEPESGFEEGLRQILKKIEEAGSRPWIVLQVPSHECIIPKVLVAYKVLGRPTHNDQRSFAEHAERSRPMADLLARTGHENLTILDPSREFLDAEGSCMIVKNGHPLYSDKHHLTLYATKEIVYPWLKQALGRLKTAEITTLQQSLKQ